MEDNIKSMKNPNSLVFGIDHKIKHLLHSCQMITKYDMLRLCVPEQVNLLLDRVEPLTNRVETLKGKNLTLGNAKAM